MSFTDEDLTKIKDALSGTLPSISFWSCEDLERLRYLIARLEAAEKLIIYVKHYTPVCKEDEMQRDFKFNAWKKAEGK